LKRSKIGSDFGTDDVRPRGEELAELHIGRAEPRDGVRKPFAALAPQRASTREKARDAPAEFWQTPELVARKGSDHAFADHDPAGPDEPETSADSAHREASVKASSPNAVQRCRRSSCARSPARNPPPSLSLRNSTGSGISESIRRDRNRVRPHRR